PAEPKCSEWVLLGQYLNKRRIHVLSTAKRGFHADCSRCPHVMRGGCAPGCGQPWMPRTTARRRSQDLENGSICGIQPEMPEAEVSDAAREGSEGAVSESGPESCAVSSDAAGAIFGRCRRRGAA